MKTLNRNNNNSKSIGLPNRKTHQQFSVSQKDFLIQFYDNTAHYPTPEEYELFSRRFHMPKYRVTVWFHNRRAREKMKPLRRNSEPWNQGKNSNDLPLPVLPQSNIWNLWEYTCQIQDINVILCQNPSTFKNQVCHQQPPAAHRSNGFIPSDLYEAQAWLKKTQEWTTYLEKIEAEL